MSDFDEYEVMFRATIAIHKSEKPDLSEILQGLSKRMEIIGHEKFLVGNTSVHATNSKD